MSLELTGQYHKNIFGLWSITHQVEIMSLIFLVFFIFFLANLKDIAKPFMKIKRKTCVILFFLLLFGFLLRNTEYIYGSGYDGLFYLSTAKLMYEKNIQAHNCGIGNLDECYLYNQHLAPAGYPYLIYLSFLIFGSHDIYAMLISSILGTLNILLVFLLCYLIFKNERMGLYSSLIFALIPFDILLSSSGAVRTTSIFFTGLTLLFFMISLKNDKIRLWSLTAITFSYSIYVRQENFLLSLPMFFLLIFTKKIGFKSLRNLNVNFLKRYSIPFFIFIFSQIPVQHWILKMYPIASICGTFISGSNMFSDFGPNQFVLANFPIVALSIVKLLFFDPKIGKLYYSIFASFAFLLSLILFFDKKTKNKKGLAIFWMWFISYFILYSLYFQCSGFPQTFCQEYIRFVQGLNMPYAILAGIFIFRLERAIKIGKDIAIPIVLSSLLIFTLFLPNSVFGLKPYLFKDSRIDEQYIGDTIQAFKKTPIDSIVFTEQASIQHLDYFTADKRVIIDIHIFTFSNYSYTLKALVNNKNKPVYIIKSVDCPYTDSSMCKFIYDNFELNKIENFGMVTLYNLQSKKDFMYKI